MDGTSIESVVRRFCKKKQKNNSNAVTVRHVRFVFFATKQKQTLTLLRIKRKNPSSCLPSVAPIAQQPKSGGAFTAPFLALAAEASRDGVRVSVNTPSPEGGCEKSVNVEPTGT